MARQRADAPPAGRQTFSARGAQVRKGRRQDQGSAHWRCGIDELELDTHPCPFPDSNSTMIEPGLPWRA
jgi:hypothetical protein